MFGKKEEKKSFIDKIFKKEEKKTNILTNVKEKLEANKRKD